MSSTQHVSLLKDYGTNTVERQSEGEERRTKIDGITAIREERWYAPNARRNDNVCLELGSTI